MSAADIWLTIALLTVSTLLTRCLMFLLGPAVKLPPRLQHALSYAPAAALSAILVPELVLSGSTLDIGWNNPKLLAGIGAAVFFLATRHLLGTIISGMLMYTALRLYL